MKKLPLFPLNVVVFPEQTIFLHIFEPRYRQLIHECDENELCFGIPIQIEDKFSLFGTEVSLEKVEKIYEDGQMDISVRGRRAFKINNYCHTYPDRLYPGGEVSYLKNNKEIEPGLRDEFAKYFTRIAKLINLKSKKFENHRENFSFKIAHHIGLTINQKIKLLSIDDESKREQMLLDYFVRIVPALESIMKGREIKKKRVSNEEKITKKSI